MASWRRAHRLTAACCRWGLVAFSPKGLAMRDEQALLRAICDDPAADVPRLAYADWCEEHGHLERGEFIRLQLQQGRLPPDDPRQEGLAERGEALLCARGAE